MRLLTSSTETTGVGKYALELLSELDKLVHIHVFSDGAWPQGARMDKPVQVLSRGPFWQHTTYVRAIRRSEVDLVHSLAYTIPAGLGVPTVVTVHDLGFRVSPETVSPATRRYLRALVPASLRRADMVIVPSTAVRDQLISEYKTQSDKLAVVHHGLGNTFLHAHCSVHQTHKAGVDTRTRPYILAVGTQEPRKNLPRAVEALSLLVRRDPHFPYDLVIAGKHGPDARKISEIASQRGIEGRIERLGYVSDNELVDLYRSAALLVYPSFFEGFGMPVLEAMSMGCPVVVSARPSLPEVAGDAAVYVDPLDPADIAKGILEGLANRSKYAAAGYKRLELFSWEAAAQRTVEVYEEARARHHRSAH